MQFTHNPVGRYANFTWQKSRKTNAAVSCLIFCGIKDTKNLAFLVWLFEQISSVYQCFTGIQPFRIGNCPNFQARGLTFLGTIAILLSHETH